MYYVWRRDDGYIGCVNRRKGRCPYNLTVLLETEDWDEARKFLEVERDKSQRHQDLIAEWD